MRLLKHLQSHIKQVVGCQTMMSLNMLLHSWLRQLDVDGHHASVIGHFSRIIHMALSGPQNK